VNEIVREMLALPPQASTVAAEIDLLHFWVIGVTMFGATMIAALALWFTVRYRASRVGGKPSDAVERVQTPARIEIGLIALLVLLFLSWWVVGARQYSRLQTPPDDALEIWVVAKQWMWKFTDAEGNESESRLFVPVGQPVKLVMTSRDVIHSFYVPDFRVKMDVVPGRYTTVWFEATATGSYPILCTVYCGSEHSGMRGEVVVLSPTEYARWLRGGKAPQIAGIVYREPGAAEREIPRESIELVDQGERIAAREGCLRCHTTDGSPHIGPSFAGLYDTLVTMQDGSVVRADEAYLTASMMDPREHIHAGFPPVMPSYRGRLDPGETAALVELIRELAPHERWDTPAQTPSPKPDDRYPEPDAPGLPTYPPTRGVAGAIK